MRRSWIFEGVAAVVAVACIATARPRAAAQADAVSELSDSYALPPTQVLPQVSFGYRSAFADLLWANVMVTQGLRMREHRPFDYVVQYMDAISLLDPNFRDPYRLADTLVAFQSNDPNKEQNVRQARRLMEKGLKQFPLDPELWLDYGQFLAYIAPSVIPDPAEQNQWRRDGAQALAHLTDIGASDPFDVYKSVASVRFLMMNGENEAAIRMLEKAYAITDDPDTRDQIQVKLKMLLGTRAESARLLLTRRFEERWRAELPFLPRPQVSILGPHVDTWRCAGITPGNSAHNYVCIRDWTTWADTVLGVDAEASP